MVITNFWGVFCCFYVPMLLMIYGAFGVGFKEGKKSVYKYQKKNRYKKVGENRNGGKYRVRR